jgi:hypothetical protein
VKTLVWKVGMAIVIVKAEIVIAKVGMEVATTRVEH